MLSKWKAWHTDRQTNRHRKIFAFRWWGYWTKCVEWSDDHFGLAWCKSTRFREDMHENRFLRFLQWPWSSTFWSRNCSFIFFLNKGDHPAKFEFSVTSFSSKWWHGTDGQTEWQTDRVQRLMLRLCCSKCPSQLWKGSVTVHTLSVVASSTPALLSIATIHTEFLCHN